MSKRYCLTLDLKNDPELIRQYKHWHEPSHIWPEITQGIREVGLEDMQIYLHGTRMFMIVEAGDNVDFDEAMRKMGTLPRQKEWETFMGTFQQSLPDAKPGEKWLLMERVFKLP
jgi:L-rhamnose mutarotase